MDAIKDVLESTLDVPVTINYRDYDKSVIVTDCETASTMRKLYNRYLRRKKFFGDILPEDKIIEDILKEYEVGN